ncbi:MAG: nitrate reductase subunit alpha [Holophagaceae bacterium]|nr:nitrate reductase subunit alpha [Holophagaceae bacterium]
MTTTTQSHWITDIIDPEQRSWEEFYRNRWQHDKVVRSTHGVNCTGSCSWNIYVKEGIVTWEFQAVDYPELEKDIPPYEPRGCQRGISFSWYLYSPIRVKYPYMRGALMDLWDEAVGKYGDPVQAWASIQADPEARRRYQRARGKGGFRRTSWAKAMELIAASNIHTIKTHGPDRVVGFSPIPAMSMLSYAAGSRYLQLLGGVNLSFYDWYCDLPPSSPEMWGEQTDVNESADWFNAKFLAVMGSNLNMTRTPDCHFAAESRHNGTKMVVFSPDFNQVAKYADEWMPLHQGQDGAFWMAVNHVILSEAHHRDQEPYFLDYTKTYTDSPFLVELLPIEGGYRPGQMLRAGRIARYQDVENPEWKFLMWDEVEARPKMPKGAMGDRWGEKQGMWNLLLQDGKDDTAINPALTLLGQEPVQVQVDDFAADKTAFRGVPSRKIALADGGEVLVATIYDLLMAQYGVDRGLPGEYPKGYDDETAPYTPAWQEKHTGLSRKDCLRFAREWARTAKHTKGKCMVIIGAGINHWYHNNLIYRAAQHALAFTGCVGRNGGGLAHYVGQEKLAMVGSWTAIAMAKDWSPTSRLMNGPSFHYVNSDQWRYEREFSEYHPTPDGSPLTKGHTMNMQTLAVRCGWLPCYPQFNKNPMAMVAEAKAAGAKDEAGVVAWTVDQLKTRKTQFSMDDPDAPENWPRVWFIWRGNAIGTSAKGHEFFMKHYLGTHSNAIAEEVAEGSLKDVVWHATAPEGKMDLVVDLNFRMDTSALYSDIVLPTASWYEKCDLNTTDMHGFINPLSAAIPPVWESKSDWEIFKLVAAKVSELSKQHLPDPVEDLVALPLAHDSIGEIAQPTIKDWMAGECEAIPGKTMPNFKVVTREYTKIFDRFCAFGPKAKDGLGAHGVKYPIADLYDKYAKENPNETVDGFLCPSLREDVDAANVLLYFAPEANGELAYRAYEYMEGRTGVPLKDLGEKSRGITRTYKDLLAQPRRVINSPIWSGIVDEKRPYSPFTYNVERMVPWRTLTGRQHLYLDHEGYIAFGEHLPTYKPTPPPMVIGDLRVSKREGPTLELNLLTPHGKWHIHSTYGDTERMLTLSRGCEPLWLSEEDARALGIADNEWVEVHNDNGAVVTRANVSARIPKGACIIYHATERTYSVPKSETRGYRRAGMNNSLTRVRLKPNLMVGGYGQFSYHFNYWGPTGVNRETTVYVKKLGQLVW